jgi:hypothetical protein
MERERHRVHDNQQGTIREIKFSVALFEGEQPEVNSTREPNTALTDLRDTKTIRQAQVPEMVSEIEHTPSLNEPQVTILTHT